MVELNPEDRYQLRKLQMDVDKKGLEIQEAQQDLDRFVLELEHRCGLLGGNDAIDPKTATINASTITRNGKARTEQLLATAVEEAA